MKSETPKKKNRKEHEGDQKKSSLEMMMLCPFLFPCETERSVLPALKKISHFPSYSKSTWKQMRICPILISSPSPRQWDEITFFLGVWE